MCLFRKARTRTSPCDCEKWYFSKTKSLRDITNFLYSLKTSVTSEFNLSISSYRPSLNILFHASLYSSSEGFLSRFQLVSSHLDFCTVQKLQMKEKRRGKPEDECKSLSSVNEQRRKIGIQRSDRVVYCLYAPRYSLEHRLFTISGTYSYISFYKFKINTHKFLRFFSFFPVCFSYIIHKIRANIDSYT